MDSSVNMFVETIHELEQENTRLKAQRDELLEALKKIIERPNPVSTSETYIFVERAKIIAKSAIENCK